jgi:nicotinamidase-related amidase/type 1 glutamine amidotransferase
MLNSPRYLLVCVALLSLITETQAEPFQLTLRYQQPVAEGASRFHSWTRDEQWNPNQTALIICDMWDSHHCVNAVRREAEIAPRVDALAKWIRSQGGSIVHAPSGCMEHYQAHPARKRAQAVPLAASMPAEIESWCDQLPSEEAAAYPLDQSAGGEDDDPADHQQWAARLQAIGRNPRAPWMAQTAAIEIDAQHDFVSDSGPEIWSILEDKKISNVILVGVHTNMCVLGRPFGLRRLAAGGKNVVLARDLTDTMYDPGAWPYASHFTGTELIISHIERFVCPTISSEQLLGGTAHRFSADKRPRLVMLIAEDEYKTEATLPAFAAKHLSQHFSVSTCFGSETNREQIVGIDAVAEADALLISVRRRPLPERELALIRDFVAAGKPMIGIRTASHAFSLRSNQAADGLAVWPEFDTDVWGGSYSGHYGNELKSTIQPIDAASAHPILSAAALTENFKPGGSLYKTSPLHPGSQPLLNGSIAGQEPEPIAWTFIRNDGGRSFYTSLGHIDDFSQSEFEALLSAGIHWACGLAPVSRQEIESQNARYSSGHGKQRR